MDLNDNELRDALRSLSPPPAEHFWDLVDERLNQVDDLLASSEPRSTPHRDTGPELLRPTDMENDADAMWSQRRMAVLAATALVVVAAIAGGLWSRSSTDRDQGISLAGDDASPTSQSITPDQSPTPSGEPNDSVPPSTDQSPAESSSLPTDEEDQPLESCSASQMAAPAPSDTLPDTVEATRQAIVAAALACDLNALASVTDSSVTADLGGAAPVEIWRSGETGGQEPLRTMVQLLALPPTTQIHNDGRTIYLWPRAAGHATWAEVPDDERQEIEQLFGTPVAESSEQLGHYSGYVLAIDEHGTWLTFIRPTD